MNKSIALIIILLLFSIIPTVYSSDASSPCHPNEGSINAYGYLLKSEQITNKSGCTLNYYISHDSRWVAIVYEVELSNYVVWLYDIYKKQPPILLLEKRFAKHMVFRWYGSKVFAIAGLGANESITRIYSVNDLSRFKEVGELVEYNEFLDIYVSLMSNPDKAEVYVAVGSVGGDSDVIESHRLDIKNEGSISRTIYNILKVNINHETGTIDIEYININNQRTTQKISSEVLQIAVLEQEQKRLAEEKRQLELKLAQERRLEEKNAAWEKQMQEYYKSLVNDDVSPNIEDSIVGDKPKACHFEATKIVNFTGDNSQDIFKVVIDGDTCNDAAYEISISLNSSEIIFRRSYRLHANFGETERSADDITPSMAENVVKIKLHNRRFKSTKDLPEWKEPSEYYEEHMINSNLSKEYYQSLQKKDWVIFVYQVGYEGFVEIFYDRDKKKVLVVRSGSA